MRKVDFNDWFDNLRGDDTQKIAARKSGLVESTISRALSRGKLSPETVIALCRAYGYSPVDGLVETGYLAVGDLESRIGVTEALKQARLDELWNAMADQINGSRLFVDKFPRLEETTLTFIDTGESFGVEVYDEPPTITPDVGPVSYAADSSDTEPEPGDDDYHDGP